MAEEVQTDETSPEEEGAPEEPAADEEAEAAATESADDALAYVPGQVIVQYKSGVKSTQKMSVNTTYGLAAVESVPEARAELVEIGSDLSVEEVIAALNADSLVEFAQPNYIYQSTEFVPSDEYWYDMWGLDDPWMDIDIDAPEAWALLADLPAQEVIVAVLDTGVDIDHPDLAGMIWSNPGETGNGKDSDDIDNDGNGFVDDAYGWNFHDEDSNVGDVHGHGTHMAGTIAAAANEIGVIGVAPNVKIMPVKVLGNDGWGTTLSIVRGVNYAAKSGARVINASFGRVAPDQYDLLLSKAIQSSGAVFVTSAGNNDTDIDEIPQYPASYALPNLLSVAAIDGVGNLASFSNSGATSVHVGAPGDFILSTLPGEAYGYVSGTSPAAAHVSGIAAVVMGQKNLTASQAVALIKETGKSLESLATTTSSGKLASLYGAVATHVSAPAVTLTIDGAGAASGYEVTFTTSPYGRLVKSGAKTDHIMITFPDGTYLPESIPAGAITINGTATAQAVEPVGGAMKMPVPETISSGASVTVTISADAGIRNPGLPGDYALTVRTTADAGPVDASYALNEQAVSLMLDSTTYVGVGAQDVQWDDEDHAYVRNKALIGLTGVSEDPDQVEYVTVTVTSTTDGTGIAVTLAETGADTGLFSGAFGFTHDASDADAGLLQITDGDEVRVEADGVDPAVATWHAAQVQYNMGGKVLATGVEVLLIRPSDDFRWFLQDPSVINNETVYSVMFPTDLGGDYLVVATDVGAKLVGMAEISLTPEDAAMVHTAQMGSTWYDIYVFPVADISLQSDTTAPQAPVLLEHELTNDATTLLVTGQADPLTLVVYGEGLEEYGVTTADGDGSFIAVIEDLMDGDRTFWFEALDFVENESAAATLTVTVDTPYPDPPFVYDVLETSTHIAGITVPNATVTVEHEGQVIVQGPTWEDFGYFALELPEDVVLEAGMELSVSVVSYTGKPGTASTTVIVEEYSFLKEVIASDGAEVALLNGFPWVLIEEGLDSLTITAVATSPDATVNVGGSGEDSIILTPSDLEWPHELTVEITSPEGNVTTYLVYVMPKDGWDQIAPPDMLSVSVTSPEDGSVVNTGTPTIAGTATAGSYVNVYLNDELFADGFADDTETWSYTLSELADGTYTVLVYAVNDAGNASASATFTVDTTPPGAPEVDPVDTDSTAVTGTAEPHSTVEVLLDDEPIGTDDAGADGAFSVIIPAQPADTVLVVRATDRAGHVSPDTVVTVTTSANANLASLAVSPGTLSNFAPGTLSYTVNVSNSVSSTTVTARPASSHATVTINGAGTTDEEGVTTLAVALSVGSNPVSIVVTAEAGNTQTYTVNVRRASPPSSDPAPAPAPEPPPAEEPEEEEQQPEEQPAPETRPVKTEVEVKDDGTAVLNVTVDETLDEIGDGLMLDLTAPPAAGDADAPVTARSASVPASVLDKLAEQEKPLVIETGTVRLHVPAQALTGSDAVAGAGESGKPATVRITVAEIDPAKADEATGDAAMIIGTMSKAEEQGLKPAGTVVVLTAEAVDESGNSTGITSFGQKITVVIPFGEADNPNHVGVYRLNRETGEWEFRGGKVDPVNRTVTIELDSFSEYAAMEYTVSFADVAPDHWAKEDIEWMAARHVVNGVTEITFEPESMLTRAQFAALLTRALGLSPTSTGQTPFADVAETDWFYGSVQAAAEAGLIQGYGGSFRPNDPVTRQEMAVIISRAMALRNRAPGVAHFEARMQVLQQADGNMVAEWAAREMGAALKLNLITSRTAGLEPGAGATRAEATVTLRRLLSYLGEL